MTSYIILIVLVFFSAGGMLILVRGRFKEVKIMDDKELLEKLKETKYLLSDFYDYIVTPSVNFWRNTALPNIYKEFEKLVSRFRINLLKIEGLLLKLTNYIRGKRNVQNNGSSKYWKDVNDFKNGLNGNRNGEKKPE